MSIRRESTIQTYDFWLDVSGASRQQRRELRHELRANLADAEQARGWRSARQGLGSVRELAREHASAVRTTTPRALPWARAAALAGSTIALVWVVALVLTLAYVDGAQAAGGPHGHQVQGSLTLVPGSRVTADHTDASLGFSLALSWWTVLVPTVLAFVVGLRPWRLLVRR